MYQLADLLDLNNNPQKAFINLVGSILFEAGISKYDENGNERENGWLAIDKLEELPKDSHVVTIDRVATYDKAIFNSTPFDSRNDFYVAKVTTYAKPTMKVDELYEYNEMAQKVLDLIDTCLVTLSYGFDYGFVQIQPTSTTTARGYKNGAGIYENRYEMIFVSK